ncbi:hypothetical protein MMC21_000256 [Puttea exsequens]|nr:hypothetical protein [Puttea exsequens]
MSRFAPFEYAQANYQWFNLDNSPTTFTRANTIEELRSRAFKDDVFLPNFEETCWLEAYYDAMSAHGEPDLPWTGYNYSYCLDPHSPHSVPGEAMANSAATSAIPHPATVHHSNTNYKKRNTSTLARPDGSPSKERASNPKATEAVLAGDVSEDESEFNSVYEVSKSDFQENAHQKPQTAKQRTQNAGPLAVAPRFEERGSQGQADKDPGAGWQLAEEEEEQEEEEREEEKEEEEEDEEHYGGEDTEVKDSRINDEKADPHEAVIHRKANQWNQLNADLVPPTTLPHHTYSCHLCSRPDSFEDMIHCDNENFHSERSGWFHYSCVGLSRYIEDLEDQNWYCRRCETAMCESSSEDEYQSATSMDDDESESRDLVRKKCCAKRHGTVRQKASKTASPSPDVPSDVTGRTTEKPTHTKSPSKFSNQFTSIISLSPSSKNLAREKPRTWQPLEKEAAIYLMAELMEAKDKGYDTEERWKIVSTRLKDRYDIDRKWSMVKNFWNREGRKDSGIDERRTKDPNRLVTGVQDPESRRKARAEAKQKQQEEEEDHDSNPPLQAGKRQRLC